MHVSSLLIFKYPAKPDSSSFLKEIINSFRNVSSFVHPFDKKLQYPIIGNIGTPSWTVDPDIDLHYHVRHSAIPSPGGEAELNELVSRLHSTMLDRNRPLWEFHLIEGLADNRFAIYFKVHHACFDGVGRMKVIRRALHTSIENKNIHAPWQKSSAEEKIETNETSWTDSLKNTYKELTAAPEFLGVVLKTLNQSIFKINKSDIPLPFEAPETIFNKETTGHRKFAHCNLSLSDVKKLGKSIGATINDIFMAVSAGAIRKYLLDKNSLPTSPLIAFVPVSVRTKGDDGGNQVSNILCNLGTQIEDPIERLNTICKSSKEGKERLGLLSTEAAKQMTVFLQAPALALQLLELSTSLRPSFNLILSNYPGPLEQLYLNGASLEAIYPVSFLFGGQGINITMTSYRDSLNFGIVTCRKSVPDADKIAGFIPEVYNELKIALKQKGLI